MSFPEYESSLGLEKSHVSEMTPLQAPFQIDLTENPNNEMSHMSVFSGIDQSNLSSAALDPAAKERRRKRRAERRENNSEV